MPSNCTVRISARILRHWTHFEAQNTSIPGAMSVFQHFHHILSFKFGACWKSCNDNVIYQQTTYRLSVHVSEIVEPTSIYVNSLQFNSRVLSTSRNCESLLSWQWFEQRFNNIWRRRIHVEATRHWSASSSKYPWLHELQCTITQKRQTQHKFEQVKKL